IAELRFFGLSDLQQFRKCGVEFLAVLRAGVVKRSTDNSPEYTLLGLRQNKSVMPFGVGPSIRRLRRRLLLRLLELRLRSLLLQARTESIKFTLSSLVTLSKLSNLTFNGIALGFRRESSLRFVTQAKRRHVALVVGLLGRRLFRFLG